MTYEEFISTIWAEVAKCPKNWRKGQSVFNVMEEQFGKVARDVQFQDGIDCFYHDDEIDAFIEKCWERIDDIEKKWEKFILLTNKL